MDKPTLAEPRFAPAGDDRSDPRAGAPWSRAAFLRALGAAGAAGTTGILIAACGGQGEDDLEGPPNAAGGGQPRPPAEPQPLTPDDFGKSDVGIARYALGLEYVAVGFYDKAIGSGLLDGHLLDVAKSFYEQEQAHADLLEETVKKLGGKLPPRPKLDVPLESKDKLLEAAAKLEDIAAAAYLGQLPDIDHHDLLVNAIAIHSVEGRHSRTLNDELGKPVSPRGAFADGKEMKTVLEELKPFLAG